MSIDRREIVFNFKVSRLREQGNLQTFFHPLVQRWFTERFYQPTPAQAGGWEAAHGLATGDGIAGLRVLLTLEYKRMERRRSLRVISGGRSPARVMPVGRWSLWRTSATGPETSFSAAC